MSHLKSRDEVPRDRDLAQELRQEINRHSQEISFNFWQEFENIRSTQQRRMVQERLQRERINTMMRDGEEAANQEAEALSRSISAQGMTMESTMLPTPQPTTNVTNSLVQAVRNVSQRMSPSAKRRSQANPRFQASKVSKSKPKPEIESGSLRISPAPSNIPRAPPTSRATMVSPNISNRTTPDISKIRLANKPKK
ncbi:hypothetical protein KR074_007647 [Drosophila pseudoananassae]|nr:hypothetical protein KR074_007647 [Drosophila pseudoananassae]